MALFLSFQYNIKKKEESISVSSPCEGRLTSDKKGPIPLPDDDDSRFSLIFYQFSLCLPFSSTGFDPVKMATNALNTITDKLPFKLPWK